MQYIDEVNIDNKRVILRCDFNVPIVDGQIQDDNRILKSIKTIDYLLKKNCSIIIMSHLGRIAVKDDMQHNSLKSVAKYLSSLLEKKVTFLDSPTGISVLKTCSALKPGDVIMLENTRYCDYPEQLESKNNIELAEYWSKLGDIFVCDAFGMMHRTHASNAGISKFLPTYFGFLVKEEIVGLNPVINNIQRPFGIFMGGNKAEDKLKYIKELLPKCDYLLIGGGIANSFLYACGYDVGSSICVADELTLLEIKSLVKMYKDKIIMPIDFNIEGDQILDLGTKSIEKYLRYLTKCKTIFINGSCGKFEEHPYDKGTKDLFEGLKTINAYIVAGGGNTLNAIKMFNDENIFDFLSSGGGASLEYIASGHLSCIDYIDNK